MTNKINEYLKESNVNSSRTINDDILLPLDNTNNVDDIPIDKKNKSNIYREKTLNINYNKSIILNKNEDNVKKLKLCNKIKVKAWCEKCFQFFESRPLAKICQIHVLRGNCNLIDCQKQFNKNIKCIRKFPNINSENRHVYCLSKKIFNLYFNESKKIQNYLSDTFSFKNTTINKECFDLKNSHKYKFKRKKIRKIKYIRNNKNSNKLSYFDYYNKSIKNTKNSIKNVVNNLNPKFSNNKYTEYDLTSNTNVFSAENYLNTSFEYKKDKEVLLNIDNKEDNILIDKTNNNSFITNRKFNNNVNNNNNNNYENTFKNKNYIFKEEFTFSNLLDNIEFDKISLKSAYNNNINKNKNNSLLKKIQDSEIFLNKLSNIDNYKFIEKNSNKAISTKKKSNNSEFENKENKQSYIKINKDKIFYPSKINCGSKLSNSLCNSVMNNNTDVRSYNNKDNSELLKFFYNNKSIKNSIENSISNSNIFGLCEKINNLDFSGVSLSNNTNFSDKFSSNFTKNNQNNDMEYTKNKESSVKYSNNKNIEISDKISKGTKNKLSNVFKVSKNKNNNIKNLCLNEEDSILIKFSNMKFFNNNVNYNKNNYKNNSSKDSLYSPNKRLDSIKSTNLNNNKSTENFSNKYDKLSLEINHKINLKVINDKTSIDVIFNIINLENNNAFSKKLLSKLIYNFKKKGFINAKTLRLYKKKLNNWEFLDKEFMLFSEIKGISVLIEELLERKAG